MSNITFIFFETPVTCAPSCYCCRWSLCVCLCVCTCTRYKMFIIDIRPLWLKWYKTVIQR